MHLPGPCPAPCRPSQNPQSPAPRACWAAPMPALRASEKCYERPGSKRNPTCIRRPTVKIAVMGSGGVGGYFGAKLAKGGADVTFVARGAHLDAMRRNGLVVEGGPDDVRVPTVQAVEHPAEI